MTSKEDLLTTEEITESDASFILDIYDCIVSLNKAEKIVSLKSISKMLKVSPEELYDFMPEILEMVKRTSEE
jgi:hypothetical protein